MSGDLIIGSDKIIVSSSSGNTNIAGDLLINTTTLFYPKVIQVLGRFIYCY